MDGGYDTDAISLTSTVESTNEGVYEINRFLSEGIGADEDGNPFKKYLVEWDNYPLHQQVFTMKVRTWEPEYGLTETGLLEPWAQDKANMGEEAFERYIKKNEHDFNQALEQHQKNGALRKQKRAKKRNKLQERHRVIVVDASSEEDIPISRREQIKQQEHSRQVVDSSSEDDVPLISVKNQGRKKQLETHNLARSNSDPPGRHSPVTRRAPLIQSTDDEEGVPSDDGSEVSLVGELVEKEKSKSRKRTTSLERINKEPNLGNSILSPKQTKFKATLPRQKPATDHTPSTAQGQVQSSGPPRKLSTPDCLTGSRTSDLHQGHGRSSGSVTQGSATILARKSKPAGPKTFTTTVAPFSTPHVERSTGSNLTRKPAETIILPTLGNNATYSRSVASIKMTNEPKTQRKSWNTDGQYKNLQSRRNAEKRSQTEGTPDLSALEFVGTRLPIFSNPRSTDPTDNPYGRRESGIRRVQEPDMNESSQQELADQAERLREKESKKIPLMCPYWRLSNNCPYPAEKCRFLHRDKDINGRDIEIGDIGGRVPPKYQTPPLTCIFWLQGPFGCRKSADICIFAHHNTGWLPQSTHSMDPVQIDSTALPISRDMVGHPNDARNSSPPREMRSVGSTCWYWAHGGCNKPEERCIYKHYDTGVIAQPPPDAQTVCRYFLNGTCRLTADMCKFSHVAPGRDLNRGTFLAMPTPQELTQQPMAERIQSRQRETAADFTVQNIIQPLVSDNSSTKEKQQQVSASTELQSAANAALSSILQPATVSSSSMKQSIEQTLKIAFNDLFEWGDDGVKRMMLDRKAFLLYHPVEHLEQLDVITRWLLMHHVEVCSLWFPGGWNYYRNQVAQGGSGIVIVHPDFEHFSQLTAFGQLLQNQIRIWSLGIQSCIEHDPAALNCPATTRHDYIEIFPIGGLVYITDDVFEEKPHLALEIVELFLAKIDMLQKLAGSDSPWADINDVGLYWRLCVRPELMDYLFKKCEEQKEALEANDSEAVARATLYSLLSDPKLIEQDFPVRLVHARVDNFPIMSERRVFAEEEPIDYFNALAHSRQEANLRMIRYYSSLHVDMRRDYRHFYVVHPDHLGACATQWKHEIQTLTDVVTPEQYIAELLKDGNSQSTEQLSDFYERYISRFTDVTAMEAQTKNITSI